MSIDKNKKQDHLGDDQRPFMGLRSFEEKNKGQFGGRDEEIKELFSLIDSSSLTVVFGKSGIGKTSLLKAGLIPELRQNFYFPIYVRIDFSSKKAPLNQIKDVIYDNLISKDPSVVPIGETTLWEFFHNVNMLDGLVTPVIILDQFEEIFTLGEERARDVLELIHELSDLAENRIPLSVQEVFHKKGETVPARYSEQKYRVAFSLREDFLARLEELKRYMPSIMDRRFRVVQMSIEQALDAAIKPGQGLIDQIVAREIIKKLPGISQTDFDLLDKGESEQGNLKVEPFLLSLLCDRINEKRIEEGLNKFTTSLVAKFNVTDVINSFYEETIGNYEKNVETAIEDRLLTEGGFRKLQSIEELKKSYSISDEIIEDLVDARILRKEIRDGVSYVELIHDVLAPVIKENRDARHEKEREEERQHAIRETRKKNRKKIIQIASMVGVVLLGALTFAGFQYNAKRKIEDGNKKFTIAQNLLIEAKNLRSYDNKPKKAAQISRLAYLIYKDGKLNTKSNDRYDEIFYNGMYAALKDLPDEADPVLVAKIRRNDNVGKKIDLKYVSYLNSKECYFSLTNGLIVNNSTKIFPTVHNLVSETKTGNSKPGDEAMRRLTRTPYMTSMVPFEFEGKKLLAMAGIPDSILVLDRESNKLYKRLSIPKYTRGGKSIEYTTDGGLILNQKKSLLHFNLKNDVAYNWEVRPQQHWYNSVKNDSISEVTWNQQLLEIKDKPFHSFSVYEDKLIAVGTNGGVILIKQDQYIELKYSELDSKRITAIKIEKDGQYLYMGNNKGDLFEIRLSGNYKLTPINPRFHSEKIIDIAIHDSLVATASWDGTVGLYDRKNQKQFKPLNAVMVGEKDWGRVISVSFSKDGQFIIAGYDTGTVLKWPVTIELLEKIICQNVNEDGFTTDDWKKYSYLETLKIEDYNTKCETKESDLNNNKSVSYK